MAEGVDWDVGESGVTTSEETWIEAEREQLHHPRQETGDRKEREGKRAEGQRSGVDFPSRRRSLSAWGSPCRAFELRCREMAGLDPLSLVIGSAASAHQPTDESTSKSLASPVGSGTHGLVRARDS